MIGLINIIYNRPVFGATEIMLYYTTGADNESNLVKRCSLEMGSSLLGDDTLETFLYT